MNPSPAEKPSQLAAGLASLPAPVNNPDYPNLSALTSGGVSGRLTDWPMLPHEASKCLSQLSRLAGELARVEGERDAARRAVKSEHSFVRQKESEIITLRDDRRVLAAECAAARELHTVSIGVINDGWPQELLAEAAANLKAARSATDASQALGRAARSLPTPPAKEQP